MHNICLQNAITVVFHWMSIIMFLSLSNAVFGCGLFLQRFGTHKQPLLISLLMTLERMYYLHRHTKRWVPNTLSSREVCIHMLLCARLNYFNPLHPGMINVKSSRLKQKSNSIRFVLINISRRIMNFNRIKILFKSIKKLRSVDVDSSTITKSCRYVRIFFKIIFWHNLLRLSAYEIAASALYVRELWSITSYSP